MVDLHNNQNLGYIIHHFHRHAKPSGLICHGPVALLSVNLAIPMGAFSRDLCARVVGSGLG